MRFFLIALSLFSYMHGNGQQWEKAKAFGNLAKNESYPHVIDPQGNIYIIGQINQQLFFLDNFMFYTDGKLEMFMTKLDSNFNVVWAKRFKNTSPMTVTDMTLDNKGDLIICGSYNQVLLLGKDTLKSTGYSDFFLAKLDTAGNFIWTKSSGGIYFETSGQVYCDKNNLIYVNGTFGNNGPEHTKTTAKFGNINLTSYGEADIFVAQYSVEGEVKWIKNFGGYSVDGARLFLNGEELYLSGGSDWQFHYDSLYFQDKESSNLEFILKMDLQGNVYWVNGAVLLDHGVLGLSNVIIDSKNNVYLTGAFVCGSYQVPKCEMKFNKFYLRAGNDWNKFIAKLDKNGKVQWFKVLELPQYFYPEKFIYLNDNHFVLNYRNEIYEVDSNIKPKNFSNVKVEDYLHSSDLKIIRDGKLTIVGDYTLAPLKLGEITLRKPDVAYNLFVARANFLPKPLSIKRETKIKNIIIYPNPAEKHLNIDLPLSNRKRYSLKIYSSKGQIVEELILDADIVLDSGKYDTGLYLFVFSNGQETGTHKISIQH